jgi:hypothetical protein
MWEVTEEKYGWWSVSDGVKYFQTQDESHARWLCEHLNETDT